MTREEQETVIVFNEADKTAEVFTYNKRITSQLETLMSERPNDVKRLKENGSGGITFEIPKKWVKIRASRIMSDEQREQIAERFRQARQNQN